MHDKKYTSVFPCYVVRWDCVEILLLSEKRCEVNVMETAIDNKVKDTLQGNENLMRMLDRGIDDMEAGRELPLDEAFQKITELRDKRRNARA